jgi:Tfp pilus assembly protein PilV
MAQNGSASAVERAPAAVRGLLLVEMTVAIMVTVLILVCTMYAIAAQARTAVRLTQDTQARLVLQGELERMRALPGQDIAPCEDQAFEPSLGVPKAIQWATFHRSVTRQDEPGLVRVKLCADFDVPSRPKKRITVEGMLCSQEEKLP